MDRICTFRSEAEQCAKAEYLAISSHFLFSDFRFCPEENSLTFKWSSLETHNTCSITFIASDDYPENCFIQRQWEKTGVLESSACSHPLTELLRTLGRDLQYQDQNSVDADHQKSPCLQTESSFNEVMEAEAVALTMEQAEEDDNSDFEYTDCESRLSSDEEDVDNYDFDPTELYEDMSLKDEEITTPIHQLLRQDIDLFRELLESPWSGKARRKKGEAAGHRLEESVNAPALIIRLLDTLGEVDCDIHVPTTLMNLSPQLAKAWKIRLDEPLVVRLNLSFQTYLDHPDPPKVEVFQPNRKECGIAPQLKNILKIFFDEQWSKMDNDVLRSSLKRSGSMPGNLASSSGSASAGDAEGEDTEFNKKLQHLKEMGFGETESRSALLLANNSLMDASEILVNMASSHDDSLTGEAVKRDDSDSCNTKRPGPALPSSKTTSKRHLSSPVKSRGKRKEAMARSMSSSHTEPNLTETSDNLWAFQTPTSLDTKKPPSLEDGFLVMLYRYVQQRVPSLNEFCVVCDCPHVFQSSGAMLMPAVCSRELCLFAFQTLGVMSNTTADIATGAEVVDLLITMAKAACFSQRKATIMTPFPNIVDPDHMEPGKLAFSDKAKDFTKLEKLLRQMPPIKSMVGSSTHDLNRKLSETDKLLYPLLNWIIYSNRSHIVKLPPEKQLRCMSTEHQYLLLSSPPAQEKCFQEAKATYGSTFAFHGSSIENWHSIIRQGLLVASGTKYQINGAAYGKGIYLSPLSTFSSNYSGMGHSLHNNKTMATKRKCPGVRSRFLQSEHLNCLALCEVIKSPELKKKNNDIWVCTSEAHICTRFFFVYEDGQVNSHVDMKRDSDIKMVEVALAKSFMPVVPQLRTHMEMVDQVDKGSSS